MSGSEKYGKIITISSLILDLQPQHRYWSFLNSFKKHKCDSLKYSYFLSKPDSLASASLGINYCAPPFLFILIKLLSLLFLQAHHDMINFEMRVLLVTIIVTKPNPQKFLAVFILQEQQLVTGILTTGDYSDTSKSIFRCIVITNPRIPIEYA